MAIITTKSIADSKPVTPLDWTGAPMKPGQAYAGSDTSQNAPPSPVKPHATRRKRVSATMSPEKRAAFGARMREYWQRKKGNLPSVETGIGTESSNSPVPDAPQQSGEA